MKRRSESSHDTSDRSSCGLDDSTERSYGTIIKMRESYGFIEGEHDHRELFFHFSQITDVKVYDEDTVAYLARRNSSDSANCSDTQTDRLVETLKRTTLKTLPDVPRQRAFNGGYKFGTLVSYVESIRGNRLLGIDVRIVDRIDTREVVGEMCYVGLCKTAYDEHQGSGSLIAMQRASLKQRGWYTNYVKRLPSRCASADESVDEKYEYDFIKTPTLINFTRNSMMFSDYSIRIDDRVIFQIATNVDTGETRAVNLLRTQGRVRASVHHIKQHNGFLNYQGESARSIAEDGSKKLLFFHRKEFANDAMWETLRSGDIMEFELFTNPIQGSRAENMKLIRRTYHKTKVRKDDSRRKNQSIDSCRNSICSEVTMKSVNRSRSRMRAVQSKRVEAVTSRQPMAGCTRSKGFTLQRHTANDTIPAS